MHVLMAEDNNVNQRICAIYFTRIGCSYSIVNNGAECLDYLANPSPACPPPDIIFMDMAMPVMGGPETTKIIRTQAPFVNNPKLRMTPIVALTAHAMLGDKKRLTAWGFDNFISKPIKSRRLHDLLLQYSRYQPVPAGPGSPMMKMEPAWGPFPLRKFRGPRSRL